MSRRVKNDCGPRRTVEEAPFTKLEDQRVQVTTRLDTTTVWTTINQRKFKTHLVSHTHFMSETFICTIIPVVNHNLTGKKNE